MRVPETIKQDLSLTNMRKNAGDLESISDKISTGKRVIRPSDDPINAIRGENQRTNITTNVSVKNNINVARNELNTIDYVLEETHNILREAKVNMLEAANGHMTEEALQASAAVADKHIRRLLDLANTKLGKTYLFSGTKTFTQPVETNRDQKKSETFYPHSLWKTNIHINDVNLADREAPLGSGNFNFTYNNARGEEQQIRIFLDSAPGSFPDLVNTINDELEKKFPPKADGTPSETSFRLQIGHDGAIYMESTGEDEIVDISSSIFQNSGMEFEILGNEVWTRYDGREANAKTFYPSLYGEDLQGVTAKPFSVKITEGGESGTAKFVIINDKQETVGEPQVLQNTNVIKDPSDPDNELKLNFNSSNIIFAKDIEFKFYPSNFAVYNGNDDYREVPLDGGRRVRVGVHAQDMFFKSDKTTVNTFDILKGAHDAMLNADQDTVASFLDDIDIAMNQVLKARARMGVSGIEVDAGESRIGMTDLVSKETLSDSIDQDVAEAATDLKKTQLKQDATYEVTSKLIRPGLLQFLQ